MQHLYCPACLTEHKTGDEICRKCNMPLVEKELLIQDAPEIENTLCAYRAETEVEALAIVGMLDEENICAKAVVKQSSQLVPDDPNYWGDVLVDEEYLDETRHLIDRYLKFKK